MRRYVYSAILCAALALVWSARADDSALLTPNQPMEVYVAPGRATTLLFRTSQKVAAISLANCSRDIVEAPRHPYPPALDTAAVSWLY